MAGIPWHHFLQGLVEYQEKSNSGYALCDDFASSTAGLHRSQNTLVFYLFWRDGTKGTPGNDCRYYGCIKYKNDAMTFQSKHLQRQTSVLLLPPFYGCYHRLTFDRSFLVS